MLLNQKPAIFPRICLDRVEQSVAYESVVCLGVGCFLHLLEFGWVPPDLISIHGHRMQILPSILKWSSCFWRTGRIRPHVAHLWPCAYPSTHTRSRPSYSCCLVTSYNSVAAWLCGWLAVWLPVWMWELGVMQEEWWRWEWFRIKDWIHVMTQFSWLSDLRITCHTTLPY